MTDRIHDMIVMNNDTYSYEQRHPETFLSVEDKENIKYLDTFLDQRIPLPLYLTGRNYSRGLGRRHNEEPGKTTCDQLDLDLLSYVQLFQG